MPKQTTGVILSDNGDGTATVQVGLSGYPIRLDDLFNTADLDFEHVRQNCRLAFLIGNYAQPDSAEFLNGVNKGVAGLDAKFGTVKILSVTLTDEADQVYTINFQVTSGTFSGQTFGVPMRVSDLTADTGDPTIILKNLGSFLRKSRMTSITPAAINAVKAASFWY